MPGVSSVSASARSGSELEAPMASGTGTLKQGGAGFRAFGCREGLDKRAKLTESEVLVHVRHFRVFACKGGALIGHCCLDSGCG